MGGWDWGFKSTPKKTADKPADKKAAAATADSEAKQQEEEKVYHKGLIEPPGRTAGPLWRSC